MDQLFSESIGQENLDKSIQQKELTYSKVEMEVMGCLRRLLKTRFLLRSSNEKWFQLVIEHRSQVQKFMSQLGVILDINETLGVIYLRAESAEIEETVQYQLGKRKQLSPLGSVLLIYLRMQRHQFFLSPTAEEVPLIALDSMREFLANFSKYKVDSQFERGYRRGLEDLIELQVLRETQAESNLYEITAVCEVILPLDQVNEIKSKAENFFKITRASKEDLLMDQPESSSISINNRNEGGL